jgi:hypothetical protein
MGYCKKFGSLKALDCICCMLGSIVVLSYMFRRYQASLHRLQIKTACTIPASFLASSSASSTLPREAPLCSEDKGSSRVCIGTSPIPTHGLGLLLSTNVLRCGDPIGIALDTNNGTYSKRGIIDHFIPQVTPMASKLNHCSENSNARIVREVSTTELLRANHIKDHKTTQRKTGRWILIATQDVTVGEELTVDYSDLPWYLWQPLPWWTCS